MDTQKIVTCACGCGTTFAVNSKGRPRRWFENHQRDLYHRTLQQSGHQSEEMVPCGCGCGKLLPKTDKRGRQKRFLRGHNGFMHNPDAGRESVTCEWCGEVVTRQRCMKRRFCSRACRSKATYETMLRSILPALAYRGGGESREVKNLRNSTDFKEWRAAVLQRDDYTCRICGARSKSSHAHHLRSFNSYPEGRFDVDNGLTLCKPCHQRIHMLFYRE